MGGNYAPDTFTEDDVLRCLESEGLAYKQGARYILSQCPTHNDQNPSVQIYKDDWFVNCHAGCGRYHITKAFPELRDKRSALPSQRATASRSKATASNQNSQNQMKYKDYDMMEEWQQMPLIPRDHYFKNIPLEVLDELGWRWIPSMHSYFIPYFSASKGSIPFAQYRHLQGDRRFTMLKDAKPTCYGTWNLDNSKLFLVEGTSDAAVLEHCSVPWIAVPSAASKELVKLMAHYCQENGIQLVYAGDNDAAGDKLKEALDEADVPYRVKQPREPYKDWGDMYEAEGFDSVVEYCYAELFPGQVTMSGLINSGDAQRVEITQELVLTPQDHVRTVFEDAEDLEVEK